MPPRINRAGDREILWHELPWSPQEHAFAQISMVFGLTPELIDGICEAGGQAERTYWAAFVEAVASCNIQDSEGKVSVMSGDTIKQLQSIANDDEHSGTMFLHEFAQETLLLRAQLRTDSSYSISSADELYMQAIDTFAPYEDDGTPSHTSAVNNALQHEADVWDDQLERAVSK